MSTLIVKYNAGNLFSVESALERIGESYIVSDSPDEIRSADRVIFPGVGEAESAMTYLKIVGLDSVLSALEQPFLGICLGLQLMSSHSAEGDAECLSIFPERVRRFDKSDIYKVPHMGWNTVKILKDDPIFYKIEDNSYFYFVHSYYLEKGRSTIGASEYDGVSFSALSHLNNYWGVQFHPEKSSFIGERLLRNFLEVRL